MKGKSMDNAADLIAELEVNYDISNGAGLYLNKAFRGGPPGEIFWPRLKSEAYALLCENSAKYKTERKALKRSVAPAVAALSGWLAKGVGLAAGASTAMAAVALLIPLKLGLNAWCESMKDLDKMTEAERKQLEELSGHYAAMKASKPLKPAQRKKR